MTVRTLRLTLILAFTAVIGIACDMPPDAAFDDTDSEEPLETDSEFETDSQSPDGRSCVEAVLCAVLNPEQTLACLDGLDGDDMAAALSLSMCAAEACLDVADNLINFGICLVQSCGPESMDCVQTSLAGAFL